MFEKPTPEMLRVIYLVGFWLGVFWLGYAFCYLTKFLGS